MSFLTLLSLTFNQAEAAASELPRLVRQDGRYALFVDGAPFAVLAAQMHNSSAWPDTMPAVWASVHALHANTLEAPIYWEQFEPSPGHYDFSNIDMLINQARQNNVRLILLWFGTWKNGQMRYVPQWIKRDPQHYPRVEMKSGAAVEDLSPSSLANLNADRAAFVALMQHIKTRDNRTHTIIMMQVENEPGLIGTARDQSLDAQQRFGAAVPKQVQPVGRTKKASWTEVFGDQADEMFSAYDISRYIDSIAAAGKAIYPLPMYVNVWMRYKGFRTPGVDYPSGGATWNVLSLWKQSTPHIDVIGTDVYTDDFAEYRRAVSPYQRADNLPWISESHYAPPTARYGFDILSRGGIGFSVFGTDDADNAVFSHAANFSLLTQADQQVARAAFEGRLWSAVEQPGQSEMVISLPDGTRARVSFGVSGSDGDPAKPGENRDLDGRVLIVWEDSEHLLVLGFDATVQIEPYLRDGHGQMLSVEEESYQSGKWHRNAIWNGDETDFGLKLGPKGQFLRITLE